MVKFLRWLFFHIGFWTRAAGRFMGLVFRSKKLRINTLGLDRAFYLEGSRVILEWDVENAWLIRVNHPGGFYLHSDLTWFTADPDMGPIRITVRGIGKKVQKEFEVRVKPYQKQPSAIRIASAEPQTDAIHAGPRFSPRAKAISTRSMKLSNQAILLPALPELATPLSLDLQSIRQCQDSQAFNRLETDLQHKYSLQPNQKTSPTDSHGTE